MHSGKTYFFKWYQRGFTLVELMVVISVMAIASSIGVISIGNFSRNTSVKQNAVQIASFINDAKFRALSQVKPTGCTILQGYRVYVCTASGGAGCNTNTPVKSYSMYAVCSNTNIFVLKKSLPGVSALDFSTADTTSSVFTFSVITGSVQGAGTVGLQADDGSKSKITVSGTGVINVQ